MLARFDLDWTSDDFSHFVCLLFSLNRQVRGKSAHQIAQEQLEEPQHWRGEEAAKGKGRPAGQAPMILSKIQPPVSLIYFNELIRLLLWHPQMEYHYNQQDFQNKNLVQLLLQGLMNFANEKQL